MVAIRVPKNNQNATFNAIVTAVPEAIARPQAERGTPACRGVEVPVPTDIVNLSSKPVPRIVIVVIERFVVCTDSVSVKHPMSINVDAIAPAITSVPMMVAHGTRVRPGVVPVRMDIVVPHFKIVTVTRIVVTMCRCVVRPFPVGIDSVLESNQYLLREVKDGEILYFRLCIK